MRKKKSSGVGGSTKSAIPAELLAALNAPTLHEAAQRFERVYLLRAITRAGGLKEVAARVVGIGYSTLKGKLRGELEPRPDYVSPTREQRRSNRTQCWVEGCHEIGGGPRYGYMCLIHQGVLTRAEQASARRRHLGRISRK